MTGKLTYDKNQHEELKDRIRELEQEILRYRQMKKDFKQNQIVMDAICEKLPLVMFIVDMELRISKLNTAAVAMTRSIEEKSLGKYVGDALHCMNYLNDPEGCGAGDKCKTCIVRKIVLDTFKTGREHQSVETSFPYIGENETVMLQILVSTILLMLPGGKSVFVCIEDITRRRHAEAEQKKMQEEVLKARKLESLGALSAGIAHDFNNILSVVMGNISLAKDDLTPDSQTYDDLNEAEEACVRAKQLTSRLITFSKGGNPVKKKISIGEFLKKSVVEALSGSNIKLNFSISDDVNHADIDESQIGEVIRNIVINAKEAMDDNGRLSVSCRNIDISEEDGLTLNRGEYIKITFKDQGYGIFRENLTKIFDPYFSTKEMGAVKGQGLGLTISYSIIKKHEGLITVESEPGQGSIVSVYLPVSRVRSSCPEKSEEKKLTQKSAEKAGKGKGKILVMDDEESIRTFMGHLLVRLGYVAETCIEGREAVEKYKKAMKSKDPFDVVILDLTNKYGMGGKEAIKMLRKIDRDVKSIIITGYSDDPVVHNFRAYGFSGFLIKPATRAEFSRVIHDVMEGSGLHS